MVLGRGLLHGQKNSAVHVGARPCRSWIDLVMRDNSAQTNDRCGTIGDQYLVFVWRMTPEAGEKGRIARFWRLGLRRSP